MKYDKVSFSSKWAASVDEAAFVEAMKANESVMTKWHKKSPEDIDKDLKRVHELSVQEQSQPLKTETDGGSNGDGSAAKVRSGNTGRANRGSNRSEAGTTASGQQGSAVQEGTNGQRGTSGQVQE